MLSIIIVFSIVFHLYYFLLRKISMIIYNNVIITKKIPNTILPLINSSQQREIPKHIKNIFVMMLNIFNILSFIVFRLYQFCSLLPPCFSIVLLLFRFFYEFIQSNCALKFSVPLNFVPFGDKPVTTI